MRCVSSSTPISAAQRKALWGTSLHHSFEKKASASVESLYNSCTDLDTADSFVVFVWNPPEFRFVDVSRGSVGGFDWDSDDENTNL
ncbi:hypothetical protein Y032_0077g1129 [Ancylostoma ceylanicum]|uniref:Uncharacterized protein n=1 Tax=Ancylostoma ceylanicum TaxID=53326 RepID=A0A016TTC8_9BILA|nr:hypothetical protein Y032_0077g1129 [Ancylostoma ceylanicum]